MKYILTSFLLFSFIFVKAQEDKIMLPSANIKTLEGQNVNTSTFDNDGKPYLVCFWATWCKPCVREFTALSEVYEDWQEETDMKIIAISVDDSRTSNNVLPFLSGKGWDFEFYLDANGDFKRAMNVNFIPHSFIISGSGEIVWQHTSFAEGGEYEIIEVIRKLIEE